MTNRISNREYALTGEFREYCKKVIIRTDPRSGEDITLPPTTRQASKFKRKRGLAYKASLNQRRS